MIGRKDIHLKVYIYVVNIIHCNLCIPWNSLFDGKLIFIAYIFSMIDYVRFYVTTRDVLSGIAFKSKIIMKKFEENEV